MARTLIAVDGEKKHKKRRSKSLKQPTTDETKHRKRHRFRPGTVANREVRRYQRSTEYLIPRLPFYSLVKEIMVECGDFRIEATAIDELRTAFEDEVVKTMTTANRMAHHAGRKTIMVEDMNAARDVRIIHPGNVANSKPVMGVFPSLPYQYKPQAELQPEPELDIESSQAVLSSCSSSSC